MSGSFIVLLAVLALGMTLRVPIAFAMIASGIVYLFVDGQDVGLVAEQIMTSMYGNYVMLAVPLFILTAYMMNASTITDRLWQAMSAVVGRLRGGYSGCERPMATLMPLQIIRSDIASRKNGKATNT